MSATKPLVAVAMSGGLDSSVTAWLLAERGEAVVGLSMLLWDHSGERVHGRCCSALDLGDAKRVAAQANIPHYTLKMDEEFRQHVVEAIEPLVDLLGHADHDVRWAAADALVSIGDPAVTRLAELLGADVPLV